MGELNHRVKNNMQMLQSLLGAAEREATSREAREALGDAVRRVGAMAAAQQGMYSANATQFEVAPFLEAIGRNASQAFGARADIRIEETSGQLHNDTAIPLALIFNELTTNAVRHGKGERSHVTISVALRQVGPEWELRVQDDGPGFRYQQTQRRASGLGLVSGLARQLGGRLEVISAGGAQCIVRFGGPRTAGWLDKGGRGDMPNWPAIDHAISEKRGPRRTPVSGPATRRETDEKTSDRGRILLVEDDFFVSLEMEAALTSGGFEVLGPANTAEEAERYADEQRPDLIVMDIRLLSSRDGVDAALAIFRKTGIRSIFATAHADAHTRARAAAAKPLGWIAKPYAMDTLVALVREAVKEAKT